MNKDKKFLNKTAELVSDAKAENSLGVMYLNSKANKKVYIANADAKNAEKEIYFIKVGVCNYCKDIFEFCANDIKNKNTEFYSNSADYYYYAIQNNVDAEKIYTVTKEIIKASKDLANSYIYVSEDEDLDLTMAK